MKKSRLLGAVCVCLASVSFNASATVVPVSIVDNGTYVTDTVTGWDWLDLTQTVNMSYDLVISEMGTGGQFEGWSYATRSELGTLWTAYGGDANYYSGWSTQNDGLFDLVSDDNYYSEWSAENNGLFDVVASFEGDLYCNENPSSCGTGEGFSHWITADIATQADLNLHPGGHLTIGDRLAASLFDLDRPPDNYALTQDYANLQQETVLDTFAWPTYGSAHYRVSAVPVPAAVWLFGSGLLVLVSMARRKKAA